MVQGLRRGQDEDWVIVGKYKHYAIVSNDGPPCPRCGRATEIREHADLTEKQLMQDFYYSRWCYCINPKCRTKRIVSSDDIVWNERRSAWDV
jgi:hypothetical protein